MVCNCLYSACFLAIPIDLQTCSAALRHLLKHTLTLPNPRAVALGSNAVRSPLQIAKRLQRTEMEQDGQHQEVSSLQIKASLPQKVRQLEEILSEIKHQCLEVDMSLCESHCLCVCTSVCVYVPVSVCMYQCLRVCTSVCVYVPVSACMYQCLRVCTSVCVYVPVSACMYQCLRVCTSVSVYVPVSACMYQCLRVCTSVCVYVPVSACMYQCLRVCTSVVVMVTDN